MIADVRTLTELNMKAGSGAIVSGPSMMQYMKASVRGAGAFLRFWGSHWAALPIKWKLNYAVPENVPILCGRICPVTLTVEGLVIEQIGRLM